MIGTPGEAQLVGGAESDMLVAGTGHQTLTGGGGSDRFVFTTDTRAVITDFQPGRDHLVFEEQAGAGGDAHGRLAAASLHHGHHASTAEPMIVQVQGHAVVIYGSVQVALPGISATELRPDDYSFA
ncbi:hypothetical protein AEGHOMDF_2211 [Methylobacterium soli]|nr:hypothetical protein AEGHOMDF_2211 [Methylobacterium soli]